MGRRNGLAVWVAALVMSGLASAASGDSATLRIADGELAGATADGVTSFKGVPYASPPVGPLRWRAPQPPASWTGRRDATRFAPDCMQTPNPGDAALSRAPFAEDCLYLNLWRPERGGDGPLPVLVWIHGGGYVTGGTAPAIYDASAFARQGLVAVSINYRLGRFGFFTHPALMAAAEGDTGNFAYLDMIAALAWVRDNIAVFGGDPRRVTVMGESAGGDAVAHLMTSPRAAGLFHQAVILSGDGRRHLLGGLRIDAAAKLGEAFAGSLGIIGTDAQALAALRAVPAGPLIDRLNLPGIIENRDLFDRTYARGSIVDDALIVGTPGKVLTTGGAARIPVMVGTTTSDLPVFLPPLHDPLAYFGPDRERAAQAYAAHGAAERTALLMTIGADMTMHEPARFLAREVSRHGRRAWLYRFDYTAESERAALAAGAPHASELPYLFATVDARYGERTTPADRAVAALFHGAVARFARTGDPNGGELPAWPAFDPAAPGLFLFGRTGGGQHGPDPWQTRLDLVAAVQDAELRGIPGDLAETSWQWVGATTQDGDTRVDAPERYTLAFNRDGRISLRADCNRATASAGAPSPGALRIGQMAMTMAMCPPGSLSDRFARDVARADGYVLRDGALTLTLPGGSGTLRFLRVP